LGLHDTIYIGMKAFVNFRVHQVVGIDLNGTAWCNIYRTQGFCNF